VSYVNIHLRSLQVNVFLNYLFIISNVISHCFAMQVYADNMPETLPADLFIRQLLRKTSGVIRITLRAIVVVFVWLIMLPYITLWVWRFYFWIGDHLALSMHNDNSTAADTFNSSHQLVTDQYVSDNTTTADSEHRYTAR
jgi:E3 ubiquitin-protein ligase DOA10